MEEGEIRLIRRGQHFVFPAAFSLAAAANPCPCGYLGDENHPCTCTRAQIDNLRRRLHLTRTMQLLGVTSLFLCVVTMFLIYVGLMLLSAYVFGAALLLLVGSLGVSIWEIQISVRALEIHLKDMENPLDKRDSE